MSRTQDVRTAPPAWRAVAVAIFAFLSIPVSVLRAGGGEGLPAIVFASRVLRSAPVARTRTAAIERAQSGRLLVREPDGTVRVLVDGMDPSAPAGTPIDVADPDVSYDGTHIVFSGYLASESTWRIFEIDADGSGLRQVTRSDREVDLSRHGRMEDRLASYDDVDPCYLPDGRICFVSTRYPALAPDGRRQGTNLYVVRRDGDDLHRITTERFGADTPAADPLTGRIVYSRWWLTGRSFVPGASPPPPTPGYYSPPPPQPAAGIRLVSTATVEVDPRNFAGVNTWSLASIAPDGTGLVMYTGRGLDRLATMAYRPSFLPDGSTLALFLRSTPFIGYPGDTGLRVFERGPTLPEFLGGPQVLQFDADALRVPYFYASAAPLPDGRIVVSATPIEAPAEFDLYVQRLAESPPAWLHGEQGTAELDAVPLTPREIPPVLEDRDLIPLVETVPQDPLEAVQEGGTFRFIVENIYGNAPVDTAVANAPSVQPEVTLEFYMNPPGTSDGSGDVPILVDRVPVPSSGRVDVELPAGVPLFEVLRLENDRFVAGRDGQVYHVGGHNFSRAGQTARCVGCHAGHSLQPVPEDPSWTNIAPGADVIGTSVLLDAGRSFQPANVVDRRTAPRVSEWAGAPEEPATIELSWSRRVQAREVVLRGAQMEPQRVGEPGIQRFTLTTLVEGREVEVHRVSRVVSRSGTTVRLNEHRSFDTVRLQVLPMDISGRYQGWLFVPAIAEIEVIGRLTPSGPDTGSFLRGDANCSSWLDLTDVQVMLHRLFRGGVETCCDAALDTNESRSVELSDAVYLLNYLFRRGPPPGAPFPLCGVELLGGLSCDPIECF